MGILKRLFIFIGILIVCSTISYGLLFFIFPDALNKHERFEAAMRTNFAFVLSTQIALLLGLIVAIKLQPHLTSRKNPERTIPVLNFRGFFAGSVYGLVIISITAIALVLLGQVRFHYDQFSFHLVQYALLLLIAAYSEELLCRGYIFRMLNQQIDKFPALLISSTFFVLLHGLNASLTLTGVANLFLSGVLFTVVYTASKNDLSVPTGLHFMWNFLQGPILGFRVSGLGIDGVFKVTERSSILSGGGFGLEGSLVTTAFLLIAVVGTLWVQRHSHRKFSSAAASERSAL